MDVIHDMTFIDMGERHEDRGNKHLFEFAHAMTAPAKFGMANYPAWSRPLNASMNKQWLSPTMGTEDQRGRHDGEKAGDYAKWWGKQHNAHVGAAVGSGSVGVHLASAHSISTDKREELRQQQRDLKEERG